MVQGVSRQVIVVKSPDPRFFEQAIFIVKEDAFGKGASAEITRASSSTSVFWLELLPSDMPRARRVAGPTMPSGVRPFFR